MTTYNTGNPIGSTDARDLYDNAQNLDNFANGASASYADRLGVIRRSLAGIEATAEGVLNGIGYAVPVAYASGISLTLTSQTVDYNGVIYAPLSSALPFTTSYWGTDSAKFRAIQVTDADLITYTPAGTGAVATTVQSKQRETVSVKDFGAVGDGVADDTAAIQAALNYAASSYADDYYAAGFLPRPLVSKVTAPSGKYKFTTITVPSGVDFIGDGAGTILLHQGGGLDGIVINGTGSVKSRHQTIGKFTIKGVAGAGWSDSTYAAMTVAAQSRYGVYLNKADGQVTVADVDIINFQRGTNNVWSVFSRLLRVRAYGCSEYGHYGANGLNAAIYESCTSYAAGKIGFLFDNTGAANNIYCLRVEDCSSEYSGEEGFKAVNVNVLHVSNWYSELNYVKNRDAGASGITAYEFVVQSTTGRSDQFSLDNFFIMNTWKAVGYTTIQNVGGVSITGVDAFSVKNGKTFTDATGGVNFFVDGNIGQGEVINYLPQQVSGVFCLSINGVTVDFSQVRGKNITLGPSGANFEQPSKYTVGYGAIRPTLERNGSTGGLFINAEGGAIPNGNTLFSVGNNGNVKFSVNGDGTLNISGPSVTAAGGGSATALPAAPDGYAFIVINGAGKYVPYYN